MNVLSLFDGMSCGQIALERAGIKVDNYYASEIDKYAIQVTKKNYPKTIHIGSVVNVVADNLPIIDLIVAGSPCKGFSNAGDGSNFEHEESKLFFEFVRVLSECKVKNPKIKFLFENVKMKKEWELVINKILGVRPIRFNSSLVSAQIRARLYWTNIMVNSMPERKKIHLSEIIESGFVDRQKAFCIDANYAKGGNEKQYREKSRRQLVYLDKSMTEFRKLTVSEVEKLQTVPVGYTSCISDSQAYKCLGNGWTIDIIAHILKHIK